MSTAHTHASVFAKAVAQAATLEPDRIEHTIRTLAEPFPGGSGEPTSGGNISDPTASTVVARLSVAERGGNPDRELADIGKLNTAVANFVRHVAAVADATTDMDAPATWEEAITAGHFMIELDVITAALGVGVRLGRTIDRTAESVLTVQRIHDGHCAHPPDPFAQLAGEEICLSHARIGDYERSRHGKLCVCKVCYDMMAKVGPPAEAHNDPDAWPSITLLRAHAHMELTGQRVDYRREVSVWVDQKGGGRACA